METPSVKESKKRKLDETTEGEKDAPEGKKESSEFSSDNIKYIVVSGGVLSGLGKGVTTSSIGALLKSYGHRVTAIKIDPYLNTDAGTMSPFEHGEVFVLDDGGEADLDLGNYERLMNVTLTKDNNITTGKIYQRVIEKERRGDYLGKTVQVIPHVTNEIMSWIRQVAHTPTDGTKETPEICMIELGGVVGDIESMPYVEALRQFQFKVGPSNFCLLHVTLVATIQGEQKTKPTQHSVKDLRSLGLTPDFLVCRCDSPIEPSIRQKLALFCHVTPDHVLSAHNVPNLFRVPSMLEEQGTIRFLREKLHLPERAPTPFHSFLDTLSRRMEEVKEPVTIALVGKYTDFHDAYLSITKSLEHAACAVGRKLVIDWIEATDLEYPTTPSTTTPTPLAVGGGCSSSASQSSDLAPPPTPKSTDSGAVAPSPSPFGAQHQRSLSIQQLSPAGRDAWKRLKNADGILVPGGFGDRGIEGKILAANWARKTSVPYLGVCLGMQVAVIEFARNVLGMADANSQEFDEHTAHRVLKYMPEISKTHMGGTMRLGLRRTVLKTTDCLAARLYGNVSFVDERHRHRYEVNPEYVSQFEENGFMFVGRDESGERMEIIELPSHPFYLGTQYHPEFKSRPQDPSPPFLGLLLAASGQLQAWLASQGDKTSRTLLQDGMSDQATA